VAFIGALPQHTLLKGWPALNFVGDKGPFAGLLMLFGFVFFVKVLYIDAAISPFGTAMVQSMATSRLTYGMSQSGYFPRYFQSICNKGTPRRALIFNMLIGCFFFLPFPSWQHMIGFLVSCLVLGYVLGPMSLMVVAKQNPDAFKMPLIGIHLICVVAFIICNLMIYWSGWSVIYKILLLFIMGYVLLFIAYQRNKKDNPMTLHVKRGAWVIAYIIGIAIISYFGNFGGTHGISFGDDFVVIAVFSLFIYALAYLGAGTNFENEYFRGIST
jgi:amino acid transporter